MGSCQPNGLDNNIALLLASPSVLAPTNNEPDDDSDLDENEEYGGDSDMTTMIWFSFDNTALDTTLAMPDMVDRDRSEPVSPEPGDSSWLAGEQVPHEARYKTLG